MKLFRASQVYKLIGSPKAKGELLTETAKGTIREIAKQDIFGFSAFLGNKYTEKGLLLEDMAIEHSGLIRDRFYTKHIGRLSNDYITGECDVLDKDNNLIIDTKCSWDFGSHPCFKDEAIEKVKRRAMTYKCSAICGCMRWTKQRLTFGYYLALESY